MSQKEAIKKMSNLRLSVKLLEAGFDEAQIQAMDRGQMMAAWAEMVVAGKDKPPTAGVILYDPDLEKERLQFEIRRYEDQKAKEEKDAEERRAREEKETEERRLKEERAAEEQRRADELKMRELEVRKKETEERKVKEEKEAEERKKKEEKEAEERRVREDRADAIRTRELQIKEKELEIQLARETANKSLVSKTKVYADALKGTMTRMPVDVVHFITYFKDVERLFAEFEVPAELRAHLLRPYLNEKASILVSRMDPKKAGNFNEVKQMLLREFKLSPSVYLEKFNSDTRRPQETCLIYSARLAAILDAYLNSRKINKSYDKLIDLLVCDRVKSTLPKVA